MVLIGVIVLKITVKVCVWFFRLSFGAGETGCFEKQVAYGWLSV